MGTEKVYSINLLIYLYSFNHINIQCCQNAQNVLDLTIFKAPYSLTSKNNLKKKGDSKDRDNPSNNGYTSFQDNMETIMEDILALLNIDVSYNERISQINNIINQGNNNYTELNLTVISTTLNYSQNVYVITPLGLKNSKREAKDGIVLFGYERRNNIKKESESDNLDNYNNIYSNENKNNNINNYMNNTNTCEDFLLNDFIFPIEVKEDNFSLYEFPNFAIYYNVNDKNYYIKDFNTGVGALMKIKKFVMEKNTLINMGSNYLVVYIDKNIITIKIFNNNTILENNDNKENLGQNCVMKEFQIKNSNNTIITIGRSEKCDIVIEDMMISKIQCLIEYNFHDKCIYLYDGDGKKESTNGTWVFILNPIKITNNFLFKAEHTLFIASLINK